MNFIHHWFPLHIKSCQMSKSCFIWAVINLRNCSSFKRFTFNRSDTGHNVTWINNEYLSHKQNSFMSVTSSECQAQWITLVYAFGFCDLKTLWSSVVLFITQKHRTRASESTIIVHYFSVHYYCTVIVISYHSRAVFRSLLQPAIHSEINIHLVFRIKCFVKTSAVNREEMLIMFYNFHTN